MCLVDWDAFGSMLSGLAAIALAFIAWLTRNVWLHQAKFQRKQDVAEDLTIYGRKALSAIELMFYPYPRNNEKARMIRSDQESEVDWNLRLNELWREQTYNEHAEAFTGLETAALRAGVVLSESAAERANKLLEGARSIVSASHEMVSFKRNHQKQPPSTEVEKQQASQRYAQIEKRTWSELEMLKVWQETYESLKAECREALRSGNPPAKTAGKTRRRRSNEAGEHRIA